MGSPAIFAGQRTKLLSAKGLLLKDGTTIDNDGVINFIRNNSGANGTTGWTEGSYTAASRPSGTFTASSGAGAFAISTTTTTPLGYGSTSFLLTKSSGASRQGRAIETSFEIPLSYRAKVLQLNIDYIINSGTFVAGSNTTDSSLIWYCAFSTDSGATYTVAEPSSFKLLSNSTTISDKFSASIQTPYNATNMKLIAYVAETANSAWVVETVVAVSPSNYVYGTPITDWKSYPMTIGATITAPTKPTTTLSDAAYWRQVGDSMEITYNISWSSVTGAAAGSGNYLFPLPSGYTINTAKLGVSGTNTSVGIARAADATNAFNGQTIVYNSTNLLISGKYTAYGSSSSITDIAIGSAGYPLNSSNGTTYINFTARVPILGWSSSVQVSDGYDGRAISIGLSGGTANTTTGATVKVTGVSVSGISSDSVGGWDSTNQRYRIMSAGKYKIGAFGFFNPTGGAGNSANAILMYVNGSNFSTIAQTETSGANNITASAFVFGATTPIDLKAGDLIEFYAFQNSGVTRAFSGQSFSIEKLAGNPVISATETVAMNYTGAPPTGTLSNGTIQNTTMSIKRTDTHGMFSGGIATIPISGFYNIHFRTRVNGTFTATSDNIGAYILNVTTSESYKNNAPPLLNSILQCSVNANGVWLNAGEQIRPQVYVGGTGTGLSYSSDSTQHEFSIVKVK